MFCKKEAKKTKLVTESILAKSSWEMVHYLAVPYNQVWLYLPLNWNKIDDPHQNFVGESGIL